jgi:hypothetical protein
MKRNSDIKREKLDGRKEKEKREANAIRNKERYGSCLDCIMLKNTDKWLKLEKISYGTCEWEEARERSLCNSFRDLTACCIRRQELKRLSQFRIASVQLLLTKRH